jgi:hypothetical protein
MDLSEYLTKVIFNKNDPDYQIEQFWYGFKNSTKNFYKKYGKINKNIDEYSNLLNEYKEKKEYGKIVENINKYIIFYVNELIHIENNDDCCYSTILHKNIKRWNNIIESLDKTIIDNINMQQFKYMNVIFNSYCCIKKKLNSSYDPILLIFKSIIDISLLTISEYTNLLILGLKYNQHKLVDSIIYLIGTQKAYSILTEFYPRFIKITDINTAGKKLCARFIKY